MSGARLMTAVIAVLLGLPVLAADGIYGVFLVRDSPDDERRLLRVKF